MVSLSLGADPRDFTLFAFGGAGPLHAAALARELGIPRVLVPARPGITNALGCVVADLRHDFVRTVDRPLADLDIAQVHAILAAQEAEGRALVAAAPVAATGVTADLRRRHAVRRPDPPAARPAPRPAALARRAAVPLRGRLPTPASASSSPRSAPPSSTSPARSPATARPSTSASSSTPRAAAPSSPTRAPPTARSGSTTAGTRPRSTTASASRPTPPWSAPRYSSRWTPPRSSARRPPLPGRRRQPPDRDHSGASGSIGRMKLRS